MREQTEPPSRNIRVIPANREQEPILANLLELYIHDFSEFHSIELGPEGRFGYKDLPDYWGDPDRRPFLIAVEDQLAGFALVKKARPLSDSDQIGTAQVWDMAEFFVVRSHRRHGTGLKAAHKVWQQFPGPWQVRVMHSNYVALQFWQRAIDEFAGHATIPASIERDGKTWAVFNFRSKA